MTDQFDLIFRGIIEEFERLHQEYHNAVNKFANDFFTALNETRKGEQNETREIT